jgi:osmotically-inducible protein OsmY
VDDEQGVLEAARRQLALEPYVGAHVDVSVFGGCIILEGRVGSYAQKRAAERAVRSVEAVTTVYNMLEVAVYALDGDPDYHISAQREAAEAAIARLRGVRGVVNDVAAEN